MSDAEEFSKAIAEAAKFGTTSIEATEKMFGFLSKILGTPIEDAVGIVGDKLQYIRWQRQNRMVDGVNKILKERGLSKTKAIPPKFAIPMLEQASLEEDDDLQDIWCRLITNSLDPNFKSEIRYAFIDIIKNLTSLDAKILKYVYDSALSNINPYFSLSPSNSFTIYGIIKRFKFSSYSFKSITTASQYEIETSLDNLLRVRCLQNNFLKDSIEEASKSLDPSPTSDTFSLTQFGIVFVEACLKK